MRRPYNPHDRDEHAPPVPHTGIVLTFLTLAYLIVVVLVVFS